MGRMIILIVDATALGTDFGDNYTGGFTVSLWFKFDAAVGGLFNISSFSSSSMGPWVFM